VESIREHSINCLKTPNLPKLRPCSSEEKAVLRRNAILRMITTLVEAAKFPVESPWIEGGFDVQSTWRGIPVVLYAIGLTVLAGCGSSGDSEATPPVAAIGSPGQEGGDTSQNTSQPALDARHPVVEMVTSLGKITIELDAESAPLTVDNFLSYVQQGHYDGTIFDQVYANQGILGGLFDAQFVEKETRTPVRNEADNGLQNTRGSVAMVRAADAIDSATAHFFINVRDNPALDHQDRSVEGFGYCVFGRITAGLDVVDRIAGLEVKQTEQFEQTPVRTVLIESVRRIR
jgi:cyclophilin family peptidyl-prolyl cis-trans isomerase